jgi:hypothetical protein
MMKCDTRKGDLARLLGALEIADNWSFEADHIAGIGNAIADGISREDEAELQQWLETHHPRPIPLSLWRRQDLGAQELRIMTTSLSATTPSMIRPARTMGVGLGLG